MALSRHPSSRGRARSGAVLHPQVWRCRSRPASPHPRIPTRAEDAGIRRRCRGPSRLRVVRAGDGWRCFLNSSPVFPNPPSITTLGFNLARIEECHVCAHSHIGACLWWIGVGWGADIRRCLDYHIGLRSKGGGGVGAGGGCCDCEMMHRCEMAILRYL